MGTAAIQGELWGTHAQDWAYGAEPTTRPLWRALLEACEVGDGTRLLDMGCGGGGLATLAESMGAEVAGLDAASSLLSIAQERVPAGDFRQGDIEELPFPDGAFDVVTACNSVQFAGNQPQAVKEAKRVLKPGGRFGIGMWCEPERCEMRAVFGTLQPYMPPPSENDPPTLTTRENLGRLVESAGFRVAKEGEVECVFQYDSPETAWQAFRSAGMIVGAAKKAGEEPLKKAVIEALQPLKTPDGGVRLSNWFRFLVCV